MVIFRENTEDIYAGIEFEAGTPEASTKFLEAFSRRMFPKEYAKIRFPETTGIGIKPVSREGTERLMRAAIEYAIDNKRKSVTHRAQGQHHEVHRRRLPELGLRAGRARVREADLHLGAVGAHSAAKGEAAANAEQKEAARRRQRS